jgi:hypothetical protein
MLKRHIACQWSGYAARLIRNKCRGRVTWRPCIRLRPLAYVTRSRPRGSIGSLPRRGAEAYADKSAPDWVWTRVDTGPPPRSYSRPEYVLSWDLGTSLWVARTPYGGGGSGSHSRGPACTSGGLGPASEVRTVIPGVRDQPWGSELYIQGSGALPQHRVSVWVGSRGVCRQVRTRLGLDTCRHRTPA